MFVQHHLFKRLLGAVALLLLTVSLTVASVPIFAQPAWESYVFIYDTAVAGQPFTGHVERITASGGEPYTAEITFGTAQNDYLTPQARLSPDARYLAISGNFAEYGGAVVLAYDIQQGLCCFPITAPLSHVEAIDMGEFDPGSRYLSFSYVGSNVEGAYPSVGGMIVADMVNLFAPELGSAIVRDVSMSAVASNLPALYEGVWAFMGDWNDAGIHFTPNCYGCEGVFESEYALYDPFTEAFSATSGDYFSIFGTTFDPTGEMIFTAQDTDYPYSAEGAYFPIANVVTYSPVGAISSTASSVIFNDPTILDVGRADWATGGQMVVIRPAEGGYWLVLERDGTVSPIQGIGIAEFFGGTPDGWLLLNDDGSGNTIIYSVEGPTRQLTQVSTFSADRLAQVLWVSDISPREAAALQPFATLGGSNPPVDFRPPPTLTVVQCPGFLDSRLIVGRHGQVTPGAANRVRSSPSLENSRIVGEIPGRGEFEVLEGPVCDPAGIAWWRVRFGDVEGWTAEGQGADYFVEPLP